MFEVNAAIALHRSRRQLQDDYINRSSNELSAILNEISHVHLTPSQEPKLFPRSFGDALDAEVGALACWR